MRAPYASSASCSSSMVDAAGPGAGATCPGSAEGITFSFFFSAGGAATFLESSEPTCSFDLNFLRMDSLWYFQNCLEASLPATLVRTVYCE
jgi:hypothetical protein